jgi:hypothetical protein
VQTVTGRGKDGMSDEQLARLEEAVTLLEADHGVPEPTKSDLLDGRCATYFTEYPHTCMHVHCAALSPW